MIMTLFEQLNKARVNRKSIFFIVYSILIIIFAFVNNIKEVE